MKKTKIDIGKYDRSRGMIYSESNIVRRLFWELGRTTLDGDPKGRVSPSAIADVSFLSPEYARRLGGNLGNGFRVRAARLMELANEIRGVH